MGFVTILSVPLNIPTVVHGCHCSGDMAVRMREVMDTPRSCVL